MPAQNTRCAGATQASLEAWAQTTDAAPARARVRADRAVAPIEQGRIRRKFAWLAELKKAVCSEVGRIACKYQKVSHRLVADLADEIVSGRYPSFMKHGEVWVGQVMLAKRLGVHERQVRRAVAVLVALGFLLVERDRRERNTNKMTPLTAGTPLFEAPEAARYQRASTSSNDRAYTPSRERAWASSNSLREEAKKESSPVGPSTGTSSSPATAAEAEGKCDAEGPTARIAEGRQEAGIAQPPASKPQCPNDPTSASEINPSFANLMRDYAHPHRAVDKPAYRPTARAAWNRLTTEQKQAAARAAPNAPGKDWLGHWLNDGRETGNFEVVEQPAEAHRVWVRNGTQQWCAWARSYQANGRQPPTTQHRVNGELQTGWMFQSEWPPGSEHVKRGGGA